tara:strand:- start:351 stop:632 length:282 start_codon:yes stop_codon:yes gene_type:complete
MSKAVPYADLKAKVRTYTDKEGKEKGVYIKIGTLFASDNFNNMYLSIEAMPMGTEWNGLVSVFKRDDVTTQPKSDNTTDSNESSPLNLSDIPF